MFAATLAVSSRAISATGPFGIFLPILVVSRSCCAPRAKRSLLFSFSYCQPFTDFFTFYSLCARVARLARIAVAIDVAIARLETERVQRFDYGAALMTFDVNELLSLFLQSLENFAHAPICFDALLLRYRALGALRLCAQIGHTGHIAHRCG